MTDLTPGDVAAALALTDAEIPTDLDNAEPLTIPDRRYANRVLRRLAILDQQQADLGDDVEQEAQALRDLIQPELDRIAEFHSDRLWAIKRQRDWLLRGLEGWARAVHADDPSVVTVKVSGGEVRLRQQPAKIIVTDDAAVAERLPTTAKPVEVAPAAVKKLTKPSGVSATAGVDGAAIPEGYHAEQAVDGAGAVVPGVFFLVADAKRFEWDAT